MTISQFNQNDISELSRLARDRYENIFNVYSLQNQDTKHYFYNILKKITIDTNNIDPDAFKYIKLNRRIPWTAISYQEYETQHLWWLILATNKKLNPLILPQIGDVLRIIRNDYVEEILGQLSTS
jgi:hypothetical protein